MLQPIKVSIISISLALVYLATKAKMKHGLNYKVEKEELLVLIVLNKTMKNF